MVVLVRRQPAADVPRLEGVGLCSYLLIGFYYTDPKNAQRQ